MEGYCKRQKIGVDITSIKDMVWSSRKDFIDFMKLGPLGAENGFNIRVDSSSKFRGGRIARLFCSNCTEFEVVAKCPKESTIFSVSSCNLCHQTTFEDGSIGGCTGSLEVPVGIKAVAANPVFKSLMQMEQNHLHSGRVSTSTLQRVLGTLPTPLQASVDVVKKAATLASGYTLQDHVDGYALVEPWLEILAEHNQKMHTIVGRMNADENLSHVVLVFPYVEAAVQFLLPMFCLDMAHMKTILIAGLENLQLGKLFVAGLTGRTAANQQLPIAIGLFRSESYEGGYKLLLESIPAEVMRYINRKEVVVSTDRGPAVLKSFESGNPLDQVTQLLCKTHLEKNLKHHGWNFHISHFERARDATTEVEYERKMLQLKEVNEPMHDYLKSIPHWQL